MPHSPFDTAYIVAQWGSPDDASYRLILGIFHGECGALCQDAQAALQDGRRDLLLRAAHTLHGAAANVGAMALARCASAVAEAAPHAELARLAALIAGMEAATAMVQSAIASGEPREHGG